MGGREKECGIAQLCSKDRKEFAVSEKNVISLAA